MFLYLGFFVAFDILPSCLDLQLMCKIFVVTGVLEAVGRCALCSQCFCVVPCKKVKNFRYFGRTLVLMHIIYVRVSRCEPNDAIWSPRDCLLYSNRCLLCISLEQMWKEIWYLMCFWRHVNKFASWCNKLISILVYCYCRYDVSRQILLLGTE